MRNCFSPESVCRRWNDLVSITKHDKYSSLDEIEDTFPFLTLFLFLSSPFFVRAIELVHYIRQM